MSSLIPGYDYDIFISYRQKDNKHDGWVTDFVNNLKGELESTFKEEISVYFDINPHNGLLETHDVNESLKEKLKCLIFIPIISRTYCDPKSFAWEHEFKVFVDLASKDQFGLKVKLPNGNVASRVLPVRIYDLDNSDIKLCESVLGGVLRSVDFIYKSSGVNRPLHTNEDHPQDNLNKTYYRDQINKVANSIREVINTIGQYEQKPEEVLKEIYKYASVPKKSNKTKIITVSTMSLVLIILGFFFIPKLFKPEEPVEKSIAVLPFINDSPSDSNTYFINGLMDELLNKLQKIGSFSKVLSRTSTEQYRGVVRPGIPEIAKELGVNYIVEGSGQKYGNNYMLRVQLIEGRSDKHLWGNSYEKKISGTKDIYLMQSEIAQSIASALNATITPQEKQLIEKTYTTNIVAYDFYHRGKEELFKFGLGSVFNREAVKRAEILFKKALDYDSTFALAYTGLGYVLWKKNYYEENYSINFLDSLLILADKALIYDDKLAEAYYIRGAYYWEKGNNKMAEKEYDQAIMFNPNLWEAYYEKGMSFYYDGNLTGSIENLQKAALLNRGTELSDLLREIASQYYLAGFPEKGKEYNLEALNLDGDSSKYFYNLVNYEEINGNYKKALELLKKIYRIDSTDADLGTQFAKAYMYSGQSTESLKYVKRWVEEGKAGFILSFYNSLHQIGYVYWANGYKIEADYYFNMAMEINNSIIKSPNPEVKYLFAHYGLACIYAIRGDKTKSYENLKIFDQKQRLLWRIIPLIKIDPFFDCIRNELEFQQIVKDLEVKYQAEHERVRKWLEEQGTL